MPANYIHSYRVLPFRPIAGIGARAASSSLRSFAGALEPALRAGVGLERRAVDRVLDSYELERVVSGALDHDRVQAALRRALDSAGAKSAIDSFFDSGMFDRLVDRLLTSEALWRLVDEIATSPAVMAAISQQGRGFADQVSGEMRLRSRRADEWLERTARGLAHVRHRAAATELPGT